jgi:D-lactate dehydrogenase
MSLEDKGRALRARPGTILGHAATYLAQHGRRVGPDPASIDAATIGGVVANNAAGMRCTLERNAYNTVRSLTFALPSGTVIDTGAADAEDEFAAAEPELARGRTELTAIPRKAISTDLIPSVPGPMPQRAPAKLPATSKEGAAAVYFPACINRIFGRAPGTGKHLSLPEALVALSARAGKPLWIPDDVAGLCCSTPWASKGYMQGHQWMANAMVDALWRWSDGGQLPVVIDAASCTHGLIDDVGAHLDDERRRLFEKLSLHDAIEWTHQLMPSLTISRKLGSAAVHPTCSTIHLGLDQKLVEIAEAVAIEVTVPIGTTCCGTAGDRGLLHPELVRSATRDEAASLEEHPADIYVSSNRTREMGLPQATGKPYESFVFAVEELTRTPGSTPR